MLKKTVLILFVLILSGCGTSFKSAFRNFNAYYNTFYNARESYEAGLSKSENQARDYNPLQPIRIHREPLGAGASDFQNAIEKGADILRKHKESKWVDDALEIIGKSYFFRKEYFSAEQKFEELYITTESDLMKQRAVFWKGRVLLELEANNQGVQYLTEQLTLFEDAWKGNYDHQIQTVLAQLYVDRDDYVNALDLLDQSVRYLPKKDQRERGYFLVGQLNERLGNEEKAFDAFDKVGDHYTDYDLQFEALKKKAEVARRLGKTDEAYRVFNSMVRDDKNTEFIAELNYELARTEQERGNYKRAEELYLQVLRDRLQKPGQVTRALVYNGLAELHRFHFNDFTMAAAYYDSAAAVKAPVDQLPDSFNASEFATSFGEYADLTQEIALKDSLIWLGSLSEEAFDSVLTELQRKKREEFQRLQKEQEEKKNTLVNVGNGGNADQVQQNNERNGFLNIRNPVVLAQASQQFRAVWGDRPLADNWRVSQLLSLQDEVKNDSVAQGSGVVADNTESLFIDVDISNVPFTPADKDSMREDIAILQYQLANLFFLSLNLPDSASYYFNKVISERPQSEVAPVTLYSLTELYSIQNREQELEKTSDELIRRFPNSIYASRVIDKYNIETEARSEGPAVNIREQYLSLVNDTFMPDSTKAGMLRAFEEKHRPEPLAAKALDEAITTYMMMAKADSGFTENFLEWERARMSWRDTKASFDSLQDSLRATFKDSVEISVEDSLRYETILDSTLTEPDFTDLFPYYGVYWDSTRNSTALYLDHYPDTESTGRLSHLLEEIRVPEVEDTTTVEEVTDEAMMETKIIDPAEFIHIQETDQQLVIRGGKDTFMSTVVIPDDATEETISFIFFINERGIIEEFQLSSETLNQSLIDAFVSAIEATVSFEPVLINGQASKVWGEVNFEIPQ